MTNNVTQVDNLLCYLHADWQASPVHAGRGRVIEEYKYKFGVVALTNCWALCEFRSTGAMIYHRYASNMSDLCMFFRINARMLTIDAVQIVKTALDDILGVRNIPLLASEATTLVALDLAAKIDTAYQIDYALHDNIRERIFNTSEQGDE